MKIWFFILMNLMIVVGAQAQDLDDCPTFEFWEKVYVPESVIQCGAYDNIFWEKFDGTSINTSIWDTYFPCKGTNDDNCPSSRVKSIDKGLHNSIIRDENVIVNNGTCKLTITEPESLPNTWMGYERDFNRGHIMTKEAFRFGIYEADIKCASFPDYWDAFWLWHHDEIDILELANSKIFLSNVYKNDQDGYDCDGTDSLDVNVLGEFHNFKMELTPFKISFFLDHNPEAYIVVHRYHNEMNDSMDFECGDLIPEGTYYIDPLYPYLYQRYYRPMFDNSVFNLKKDGEIISLHETPFIPENAIMEIDNVKVYERDIAVCGGIQYEVVEPGCAFGQRCFSIMPMGDNNQHVKILSSSFSSDNINFEKDIP